MSALSDMMVFLRKRSNLSQLELAKKLGVSRSTISMYETDQREPDLETLEVLADLYNVDMNTLTGRVAENVSSNLHHISGMYKVPRLGRIACGSPVVAEENAEEYDDVPDCIKADFTLLCVGDSMVNAGIQDGDIVYIHSQPTVDNGDIAAVMIGDEEATLKRFKLSGDTVFLIPENSKYDAYVFKKEEMNNVRIIGKAVGFTRIFKT